MGKASSRFVKLRVEDNGTTQDFGPGGTNNQVGTFTMQFAPSVDFVGSFQVLAKVFGPFAESVPFMPVSYRRVNVAGAAADYAIVADLITAAGIIQIPCNGTAVALGVTISVGSCQVYSWDMNGPSAI